MSDLFAPGSDAPNERFKTAEPERLKDAPKRFYEKVAVDQADAAFVVALDGRPIRTPGRSLLALPNEDLAQLVAREWEAQLERIDPLSMPATRLANTALDGVADAMDEVRADIVRYAGSDLLCYRADEPAELIARESGAWDPILAWSADELGTRFVLGQGIVPVEQPANAIQAFERSVSRVDDPFALAGLHVMTSLTGSAILAVAAARGAIDVDAAWLAAHVEEDWNIALWGADDEAAARRQAREIDMRMAARFAGR